MIKAKTSKGIILGLSDENLERLKAGQPIVFNLSELGLPDNEVMIFNGKTEQDMYVSLKHMMHPTKTKFHHSRANEN